MYDGGFRPLTLSQPRPHRFAILARRRAIGGVADQPPKRQRQTFTGDLSPMSICLLSGRWSRELDQLAFGVQLLAIRRSDVVVQPLERQAMALHGALNDSLPNREVVRIDRI
ncbi:hypothetical protein [Candidatus Roseilinea sp. NK_OTU-006]|jgi:hypothetical protein|uniref:hypothetical protein n=1 Tax=Candidatus Roseilinea sp. NK_OTU-006 TaxID=2704250 RepID=UPI00197D0980|nr:hypothetical protein [Candidatus Roseilinea sp. NK_OTU-006]